MMLMKEIEVVDWYGRVARVFLSRTNWKRVRPKKRATIEISQDNTLSIYKEKCMIDEFWWTEDNESNEGINSSFYSLQNLHKYSHNIDILMKRNYYSEVKEFFKKNIDSYLAKEKKYRFVFQVVINVVEGRS